MTLLSPDWLWLLLIPIALAVGYVVMQLRRPVQAARFTNVDLLDLVAPKRSGWWRHVPPIVLAMGLLSLVLAMAHPVRDHAEALGSTVVLAIDVSLSMGADDVKPTRLDAAKDAAVALINTAPKGLRIGLITFAGTTSVDVAPTTDHGQLKRAISSIRLGKGTAIGEAIYTGISLLTRERDKQNGSNPTDPVKAQRLVVMSDGETTVGRPNSQAAAEAKTAGIAVDTIAFGTADGVLIMPDGQAQTVPVSPIPLQDIADTTGGTFYESSSASSLKAIFGKITGSVSSRVTRQDRTPLWLGIGTILVSVAAIGSLLTGRRFP